MKNRISDWTQSKPLLYFLFLLYLIVVGTFLYRQDTPSLIVFFLLFFLFYLITKNMIVVLGSSLGLMMVLILFRQSVKEGLTQPDETKPGDPPLGSKKIPEDILPKEDDFEMTFKTLEKNLNDINRIEEETRLKLNALKELHGKGPKNASNTTAPATTAQVNVPTKPVPPL
jgi:hypothetical protein